jgi:hypothetical protein
MIPRKVDDFHEMARLPVAAAHPTAHATVELVCFTLKTVA